MPIVAGLLLAHQTGGRIYGGPVPLHAHTLTAAKATACRVVLKMRRSGSDVYNATIQKSASHTLAHLDINHLRATGKCRWISGEEGY
jgi:hypothetical protein